MSGHRDPIPSYREGNDIDKVSDSESAKSESDKGISDKIVNPWNSIETQPTSKNYTERVEKNDFDDNKSNASSTDDYVSELLDPSDRKPNVWHVVEAPRSKNDNEGREFEEEIIQPPPTPPTPPNLPSLENSPNTGPIEDSINVSQTKEQVDETREGTDRDRDHDRERNRDRDRDRDRGRDRDRERDKDRVRDKDRERERDRDRDRRRNKDHDRDGRSNRHSDRSGSSRRDRETRYRDDRDRSRSNPRDTSGKRKYDNDHRHSNNRDRSRYRSSPKTSSRRRGRSRSRSQSPLTNRNSRTILMMQLNPKVESHDLEEFFSDIGRVKEVRLITDNKTRRHKGIAYIEFEDTSSATKALELNGKRFFGAPMVIQSALVDKAPLNDWSPHSSSKDHQNNYRIYVGGLHVAITEDMLRTVFEPFGPIVRVELMKDRNTNISRGYAFITYADIKDGQLAVSSLDGLEIAGKNLRISKSK